MVRRCLLLIVVASLALSGGYAWGAATFVDLSATAGYTQANPTGVAYGGYTVSQGPMPTQPTLFYNTFLYPGGTAGTMANITPAFTSVLRVGSTNMNASGQFVACQTSPAFGTGSTGGWTYNNGTATQLPYYYSSGTQAYETYATAINNNGDTAGYYRWAGGNDPTKPFIRTGGAYYALNDTTAYGSIITAMNTSGQAVGCTSAGGISPPSPQAMLWTYAISGGAITSQTSLNLQTKGGLANIYPSVYDSVALAINGSGQVVIAADNDGVVYPTKDTGTGVAAFLYNSNTQAYTSLGGLKIYDGQMPIGTGTQYGGHAQAINDSGSVVGYTGVASDGSDWHAAIWQNGTLTDLNTIYGPSGLNILPAGFTLNNALAIDKHGDIAGYGTDAQNNTNQAFVIYTPLDGDANLDGKVDVNDLSKVLTNYDKTGMTWAQGDFTGDGKVDVNDLSKVLTNYDKSAGASAGSLSAVPEPSTLLLTVGGLMALLACAWRKRN